MLKKKESAIEIRHLSDFKIDGRCKNIIDCIRRVRIIYWVIGIGAALAFFLIFMPDSMRDLFFRRLRSQWVLTVLAAAFCIVAVSLVWKTGERIDVWIFTAFNIRGQREHWVDWTMLALTQLGSGVFAMLTAVFYFLRANHIFAYEIVLGTLSLWLVVELLKIMIRRPRPYVTLKNIRVVGPKAGGNSFPSGHTSQSFFLAVLFSHYYQVGLPVAFIFYAAALTVGLTRMYVGMHYPRDVIGGSVLGTAWGLFGVIINNYFF